VSARGGAALQGEDLSWPRVTGASALAEPESEQS
jgi:hypothetical protein